jgi:hypothetical protein
MRCSEPGMASRLQSLPPVRRVAELRSFGKKPMKDTDFTKTIKKLFALQKERPLAAARAFVALADKCERISKRSISSWHIEQALGFAAVAFECARKPKDYLEVELRIIERHRATLRYHGHGLANSLGRLALAHFTAGKIDAGIKYAYESLRYFADYPEPSYLIEKLGPELKKHRAQ